MGHYEVGDWVDFVRGIPDGSKAEGMAAHLESGCAECLDTYRWLHKFFSVAGSSGNLEVPEKLVGRAEDLFEWPPRTRFNTLFPLTAHLVLDAGGAMQAVDVRSAGMIEHVLYRARDFTIDLKQESGRGSANVSLVGQISRETAGDEDTASFPVAVFSGDFMLANSLTNEFGAFSVEYSRRPNLKLAIAIIETGCKIELPLTRSAGEKDLNNKEE